MGQLGRGYALQEIIIDCFYCGTEVSIFHGDNKNGCVKKWSFQSLSPSTFADDSNDQAGNFQVCAFIVEWEGKLVGVGWLLN